MNRWKWRQPISEEIFKSKYALRGETIEEAIREIASIMSDGEWGHKSDIYKKKFIELMSERRFVPAGRIWSNARKDDQIKNYSNCFTIAIEDSMHGIYDSLKEDALIGKVGGGVGMDVSSLRPKDESIAKGGKSSGSVSFLRVFNESAKIIQTGGGRRAAHIALMSVDHPDIEEFILAKQGDKNSALTQFNISVKVSDKFIKAVNDNADWPLVFNGKKYKTVKAKYLYELIMKNMYINNEPGVFFSDTVERYNNAWWAMKLDRCNPCGEIVMPAYGACQLGHMFLPAYVNKKFDKDASFDFERFKEDVKLGVRFLDNCIDVQEFPIEKINKMAKDWRRIGLGFMGLADTFAMLGYQYGDNKSKEFSIKMAKALRDASYDGSVELAREKGAFPAYEKSKIMQSKFIEKLPEEIREKIKKYGLRNIGLNTTAPTGTISLSIGGNCSSGIEPIFDLSYTRTIRTGKGDETKKEEVYNGAWLEYIDSILKRETKDLEVPEVFKSTVKNGNINIKDEIDIQALIQRYIDHSISKTINLPKGTNFEQYKEIFMYAFKKGLKGFTTFNPEGSVRGILEFKEKEEDKKDKKAAKEQADCGCAVGATPPRPEELPCDIFEVKSMEQKFLVIVGLNMECPYEIFVGDNTKGKVDVEKNKLGIVRKVTQGRYDLIVINDRQEKTIIEDITKTLFHRAYGTLARFLSMSLRHKVPIQFIIDQLTKDSQFISFERAVARVLKKYLKDGDVVLGKTCPVCGSSNLIFKEKCQTCRDCNWSACP